MGSPAGNMHRARLGGLPQAPSWQQADLFRDAVMDLPQKESKQILESSKAGHAADDKL
jgi:hypothetical protein